MIDNLKRKLALARLIPVYPDMVRKKDLMKVLDADESKFYSIIRNFEGLMEQDGSICFISLRDKKQSERKNEHMLAECQQRDNGGAL